MGEPHERGCKSRTATLEELNGSSFASWKQCLSTNPKAVFEVTHYPVSPDAAVESSTFSVDSVQWCIKCQRAEVSEILETLSKALSVNFEYDDSTETYSTVRVCAQCESPSLFPVRCWCGCARYFCEEQCRMKACSTGSLQAKNAKSVEEYDLSRKGKAYSKEEKEKLEEMYTDSPFPPENVISALAKELQRPVSSVATWLRNRRRKSDAKDLPERKKKRKCSAKRKEGSPPTKKKKKEDTSIDLIPVPLTVEEGGWYDKKENNENIVDVHNQSEDISPLLLEDVEEVDDAPPLSECTVDNTPCARTTRAVTFKSPKTPDATDHEETMKMFSDTLLRLEEMERELGPS